MRRACQGAWLCNAVNRRNVMQTCANWPLPCITASAASSPTHQLYINWLKFSVMVPTLFASNALKVAVALRMNSVSARNSVSCSEPPPDGSNLLNSTRSAGGSNRYPAGAQHT